MLISRFVVWTLAVGTMVLGVGLVAGQDPSTGSAQAYPNKPIRIVTAGVGGDNDFMARLIAQGISGPLGQQVVVANYPSGAVQGEIVAKAPPDGYTVLAAGGSFTTGPLLQQMPFDPVRDFSPITLLSRGPNVLIVHPSLPVKSVKELIALAKARPGELNYASGPAGGGAHLATELFNSMTGVKIVRVSYPSGALRLTASISGEVQVQFTSPGTIGPHVKTGKLKALAVTTAQPSALAPGVPTVAASVPGYEQSAMNGVLAPAKTPEAIIKRLNQEIVRFINQPNVKQKFFDSGAETVGNSPEEFAAAIQADIAKLGKLIKDAGIRIE